MTEEVDPEYRVSYEWSFREADYEYRVYERRNQRMGNNTIHQFGWHIIAQSKERHWAKRNAAHLGLEIENDPGDSKPAVGTVPYP